MNDLIVSALEMKADGIKPGTLHQYLYTPLQELDAENIKEFLCRSVDQLKMATARLLRNNFELLAGKVSEPLNEDCQACAEYRLGPVFI